MKKEYFRILAPFTRVEDVKLLKDAGADELYCGYVTEKLTEKWPLAFNVLNRRGEGYSFENYRIFKEAAKQAHNFNLPVYVTINGLYTPEQYPFLFDLVEKIERLEGVSGIIVADVGFLLALKKNNFRKEIHISTGGTTFNSSAADFFHDCGAQRVILDRQLTSHEIGNLIKEIKSGIDIELFIIAEGCWFIDGFCTFFHCYESNKTEKVSKGIFLKHAYNPDQEPKGCAFIRKELEKKHFKTLSTPSCKEVNSDLTFQIKKHSLYGCRICDLYELKKYPIKSLKIVGRGRGARSIVDRVKMVSTVLRWLEGDDISKRRYQQKCKNLFSEVIFNNKNRCSKFDCYFSPFWVKDETQI